MKSSRLRLLHRLLSNSKILSSRRTLSVALTGAIAAACAANTDATTASPPGSVASGEAATTATSVASRGADAGAPGTVAAGAVARSAAPMATPEDVSTVIGEWTGWFSLSGGLSTDPVIVADGIGARRDVFATGPDGKVYTRYYDGQSWYPAGTGWISLGNLGNPVGPPAAVAANGRVDLFAIDSYTGHMLQQEMNNGIWSARGWADLGGGPFLDAKPTVTMIASIPTVFAATGSTPSTIQEIRLPGYDFPLDDGWVSLGGNVIGEPGAVSWGSSRLDVFASDPNGALVHRFSNDGGNTWGPASWEALGGTVASTPSVLSLQPNTLDVFVTGSDAGIHHIGWTGSAWSSWVTVGGIAFEEPGAAPVVAYPVGGRVDLFVQGGDRGLWVGATSYPFTTSTWTELTSCFRTGGAAAVDTVGGALDVVVTAKPAANGAGEVWFASTDLAHEATLTPTTSSLPTCPCGRNGEACCGELSCGAGLGCFGGGAVCNPCGGAAGVAEQPICPYKETCNAGFTPNYQKDICVPTVTSGGSSSGSSSGSSGGYNPCGSGGTLADQCICVDCNGYTTSQSFDVCSVSDALTLGRSYNPGCTDSAGACPGSPCE